VGDDDEKYRWGIYIASRSIIVTEGNRYLAKDYRKRKVKTNKNKKKI